MYNNIGRVQLCLDSILAAAKGLDYEIVIVDNYSTDGSFEVLKQYSRNLKNLKLLRCKCLRGLGRQIAFSHSKGKYVITIDMDTKYPTEKIHKFLLAHKQSEKNVFAIKTWGSFCVFPRVLIESVGGWKNFNVGEDMDLLARLFSLKKAVFVPIHLEINEEYHEIQAKTANRKFFETFRREHRYAKGLNLQIRLLQNKIDFFCANAYTLKKTILHHRFLKMNLLVTVLVCFQLTVSKLINCLLGSPVSNVDSLFTNSNFVFGNYVKNFVDPREFGLELELGPSFLAAPFKFIQYLDAEVGKDLLKFLETSVIS